VNTPTKKGRPVTVTPEPIALDERASDSVTGRDDPQQRFRIYRLCDCFDCNGRGKVMPDMPGKRGKLLRCDECRGEGKVLDLVATAPDEAGLGTAIVKLGQEGEFEECPLGVLDNEGEKGKKWLVLPWLPSPRNVSDAAKVLARAKGEK